MVGYIYNATTRDTLLAVAGETNEAIDQYFSANYDADEYALTYTPAFDVADGLRREHEYETVKAVANG